MMQNKKLAMVLFGSLAANLFLGGVVTAQLLHPKPEAQVRPEIPTAPEIKKKKKAKKTKRKAQHAETKRSNHRRHGPPSHGSRDLVLLRHMVKIMGGPHDPRIKELHDKKKGDIKKMRAEMRAAHERVYQALSAENPDDQELTESLKALRKKTFEAQARAQEGIVKLAGLMTDEERAKLREFKPPGAPERMRRRQRRNGATPPTPSAGEPE